MVQKPPLCLGGGGLGVDRGAKRRGAAVWVRRPSCPDMTGGNCAMRGARSGSPHVEGASKRGDLHQ